MNVTENIIKRMSEELAGVNLLAQINMLYFSQLSHLQTTHSNTMMDILSNITLILLRP